MKPLPKLTKKQRSAARYPGRLLVIEAGPGTGKTVTAAERFGYLAHDSRVSPDRGVLVLSFTVGATSVVRRAIRRRWGHEALAWPHGARTFDSVFRSILDFLLRSDRIVWPGGHFTVDAIDDWQKLEPALPINPVAWRPCLKGRTVDCRARRVEPGSLVVTAKKRLAPQLERGWCSHESIRELVLEALLDAGTRLLVIDYLAMLGSAVVVDEAFDANETDVQLLQLFAESGCSLSLVGDPWQALYGFRDARPELLEAEVLDPLGFERLVLEDCFRFTGTTLIDLMASLRAGEPCPAIGSIERPDVVLAAEWSLLWQAGPTVLPAAFGQVRSKLDAVMILLLDTFLRARAGSGARLAGSACKLLEIEESALRESRTQAFGPVLDLLDEGAPDAPEIALDLLSRVPKDVFGAPKKLAVGRREIENHGQRLKALGERIRFEGVLVPGLTVHQAKGDEWGRVAVVLSDEDVAALEVGLRQHDPDHRRLYVSLTRARFEVGQFVA